MVRLSCNGQVGVIEGRECVDEDLPLRFLEVRVGVESVALKGEAFRAILAASPAVETRAECIGVGKSAVA